MITMVRILVLGKRERKLKCYRSYTGPNRCIQSREETNRRQGVLGHVSIGEAFDTAYPIVGQFASGADSSRCK